MIGDRRGIRFAELGIMGIMASLRNRFLQTKVGESQIELYAYEIEGEILGMKLSHSFVDIWRSSKFIVCRALMIR